MSKQVLGLDLGTNSIGWAVLQQNGNNFELHEKGVHIFPKGVGEEKNNEYSLASERTGYRSARRLKFRRKLRKIETLKVLIEHKLCPTLTEQELTEWRNKKIYPTNETFINWLLTDDEKHKNPYCYRNLAVTKKLDLSDATDRFKLGRAFYHIAQRRGFKSNALNQDEGSDGAVNTGIRELQVFKNGQTLGQYFYSIYGDKKIREQYTDREQDYLDEIQKICLFQELGDEFLAKLKRAIFFQRPLKSQKGNVANCPFETNKKCIQISHPMYELFRMYQFVNNIKIQTPRDSELRSLTTDERNKIIPLFFQSQSFKFEKIAKKLVPTGTTFGYYKHKKDNADCLFNYQKNTTVSNSPFIGAMMRLFDVKKYDDLLIAGKDKYINSDNKTAEESLFDLWHVLVTYEDSEKRKEFAIKKLNLTAEKSEKFDKIKLTQGYGNLSLKAIKKFLPFLTDGTLYSHAAFLANMDSILKHYCDKIELATIKDKIADIFQSNRQTNQVIETVNAMVRTAKADKKPWNYDSKQIIKYQDIVMEKLKQIMGLTRWEKLSIKQQQVIYNVAIDKFSKLTNSGKNFLPLKTIKDEIADFLRITYGVANHDLDKLYHPSAIESYPQAEKSKDGRYYLDSPRISAIKNPVFMRTMHRLRALINELIKKNIIDPTTEIHIEMTRELNDANRRKAVQQWQKKRESARKIYQGKIEEFYKAKGQTWQYNETDILKYQLRDEQNAICPYTGKEIGLSDFLGNSSSFDIEHTFPRSRSCDNSQENKTLSCQIYNRQIKQGKIPSELPDHAKTLQRVESFGWEKKIFSIEKQIEYARISSKTASTKEGKDNAIIKRHLLELERNYYREKLFRFTTIEIPNSFSRNQLVNTQIICKYANLYLKTVFNKVYSYKAKALKPFYQAWGVDEKQRDSHLHHCIDAILVACISRDSYSDVAKFYHEQELYEYGQGVRPQVIRPWNDFAEDLNHNLKNEVLVTHYSVDNLLKPAKKAIRKKGIIQKDEHGNTIYMTGDSARGSLHKDTFYGAIKCDDKIKYVNRKRLTDLKTTDIKSIVDPYVRQIVEDNKDKIGKEPIWLNEKKGIEIKKVRCFAKPTNPIALKKHRDLSAKEHKQCYHVVNDNNYAIALYGNLKDPNTKKHITSKMVINYLDAVNKTKELGKSILFPEFDKKNNPLRGILKIGSKVMFYENTLDELKQLRTNEINKRIYIILGLEGTGRLKLRHHLSVSSSVGDSIIDFNLPKERLLLMPKTMLVEGADFTIGITGNVEFIF
ncbi:MAG: hypothetical protein L3J71_11160 [Victivallaceae bacterium]|nr:hypothetical protein [Victivallaceae bacterium]